MPQKYDITVPQINRLKPGESYNVSPGCEIECKPDGKKKWVCHYRIAKGSQRHKVLGYFPALSLADARTQAAAIRSLAQAGTDPRKHAFVNGALLAQAEQQNSGPQPLRLEDASADYLERMKHRAKSWPKYEAAMRLYVLPKFGNRDVHTLQRQEVIHFLEQMVIDNSPSLAKEARKQISALFTSLYNRGVIEHNRFLRMTLETLPNVRPEPAGREFTDAELRVLWRATSTMGYPYGTLVKLLLLTGARRDEVGDATWDEIDLAGAAIHVPAGRFKSGYKTGVGFDVPLCRQAVELLMQLPRGSKGPYVFSTTYGRVPMKGWTQFASKLRMKCAELNGGMPLAPYRAHHDYRVTVRTRLSYDIPFEVREAVIGHAMGDLERRYDVRDMHAAKVAAVKAWADELHEIVKETPVTNLMEVRT